MFHVFFLVKIASDPTTDYDSKTDSPFYTILNNHFNCFGSLSQLTYNEHTCASLSILQLPVYIWGRAIITLSNCVIKLLWKFYCHVSIYGFDATIHVYHYLTNVVGF